MKHKDEHSPYLPRHMEVVEKDYTKGVLVEVLKEIRKRNDRALFFIQLAVDDAIFLLKFQQQQKQTKPRMPQEWISRHNFL